MQRVLLLALAIVLGGCVSGPKPGRDSATAIDPKTAAPLYWIEQPAAARVSAGDYDRLWKACDAAARSYRFVVDRLDYRQGIMTSVPLVSRSALEFWRDDVIGGEDVAHSTLATYRRTIRYELGRRDDERFEVGVKVLVERSSSFERRVTTGIQFRDAFGLFQPGTEFISDDGVEQPAQYWFAVGRDADLEAALTRTIQAKLAK